ncbi:ABC transporter [Colletotrichum musicola]|uniref:ABC transporter n=1 Tax=Colletotrichum musicola TaxID=2175873 RepID=A0A8H6N966_9PEZI|nr:ABC transporter [Colletotrichum musicola]
MTFQYYEEHRWRNVGILFGFLAFLFPLYLVAAEYARPPRSKGEVLVFPSGKVPRQPGGADDVELQDHARRDAGVEKDATDSSSPDSGPSSNDGAVFHWEDLCYDIKVKGEERRLLSCIDGWVKPGTSTALMGVSGAGKTTLLDVLASRATSGSVSGDTLIDGSPTDASFQHRVGYVQQQDLHLDTATAREALEFSALLRQSAEVPRSEKLEHVERVLDMLDMRAYADAVVGTPGEGLNVEQRKRLSIGVELAARPQLLLFLDEPTSGLDSQTSWSVSQLIKKLTRRGQAVLCTIHQPSALLFGQFDRLLLLAPGGKTVYFGGSKTLIDYFERNGAPRCPDGANQAEWMLDVLKPKTDDPAALDWHKIWKNSPEFQKVKDELSRLRGLPEKTAVGSARVESEPSQHRELVASSWTQFILVLGRTWRHFWRSPSYIWSKVALSIYIGFSFRATNTIQGLQNQLYAIFMFLVMFNNINEQIMPMFVPQRSLYEARERPSKIYEWTSFVLSNILVEAAWNTLMAVLVYVCWYYPVGFLANTTPDDRDVRGLLAFLFLWMFMLFTSTFSHLAVTWAPNAEIGGVVASMLWMFCLVFCGVAIPKVDFPTFWRFMYPVSPGTYLVGGVTSAAMTGSRVSCSDAEFLNIPMAANNETTCLEWLGPFAEAAGGYLVDSLGTTGDICRYCPISNADQFLSRFNIRYDDAWRNFGILWVYVLFNAGAAMGAYWLFRMPKGKGLRRQRSAKE